MANFDLGRVVPLLRGDYSAAEAYELNDIVAYNGSVYWHYADTTTTGVAPTETSVWRLVVDVTDAEAYVAQAIAAAAAADGSAEDAEAYAVGKRDGADVSSGDPAYHNNAKYYAGQASGSATAAGNAQTAAETAEDNAEGWATGGSGGTPSASNNAKKYAEDAASSAAAAAESAAALVIDDTLSVAGRAADAKAAGDAIHATQSMIAPREASSTATRNYSVGDLVIVGDVLYRVTAAIASGETITAGTNVTADAVSAELAALGSGKADKDGTYEDLTAGNAEQLVSDLRVHDKVPYVFRTAGGAAEIGDRAYIDKIVGGTVAWNQIVQNGDFASDTGWGATSATLSIANGKATLTAGDDAGTNMRLSPGTIQAQPISGHIYFASCCITPSRDTEAMFRVRGNNGSTIDITANTRTRIEDIVEAGTNTEKYFVYVNRGSDLQNGDTVTIEDVQLFDLTQMFGAAIAEHVAALETANAGAGAAWFRSLFPNDYYAYDAGTLRSVNTAAHRTVGFNAFDASTADDGYVYRYDTGAKQENSSGSCQLIKVLPKTTYYLRSPRTSNFYNIVYFDAEGNGLGTGARVATNAEGAVFTTPLNCGYVGVNTLMANKSAVCLNLHFDGSRDGDYEPYSARTYALDDTLTLRGIPKLDANDNLYYDGDEYAPDGTVTRRYGTRAYAEGDESLADAITDGTNTVYKLAEPTTEAAAPYTSPQIVDNWGTEEYTDAGVAAGTRDVAIPVGHETGYPVDLRAKIEAAPDSPDADGDYIMRRSGGANGYAPLTRELPAAPEEDGTYRLVCTVSGGEAAYSWEAVT